MSPLDELARRLAASDLRLPAVGEHVEDERLACIAEGADPTDAEARHLAGCDDCLDVLMLLGPGLAAEGEAHGATPAPEAGPQALTPPLHGPRPRRAVGLALLAFAGVAAASLWVAGHRAGREAPAAPVAVAVRDATIPDAAVPDAAVPDAALPDAAVPDSAVPDAAVPDAAVPDAAVPDAAVATSPGRPRPARRPVARPARPQAVIPSAALAGAGDMHGPVRRPINGPPRGYGYLRLTARPPAQVFVDGKPVGWTPLLDRRLPEGPHDVRLVFDSPLAAEPEQRLRVIIEPDRIWKVVQDNRRRPGAP
ncbi:MAG: hypothetical protein H6702_18430 [Myxococcales bacterium]|nr:hypothetical protein [Myxococcales bacterium]